MKNGDCKHIALFGTFMEGRYFRGDFVDAYDLIGINGNIVAHAPEGIAAFLGQVRNKGYFIDPQTHAFQQHASTITRKTPTGYVLKQSIRKLADAYGSVIAENVGINSVSAGSISGKEAKTICENVLRFQYSAVQQASERLDIKDFLEFIGPLTPAFLVAPYFYLEADSIEREIEDNVHFAILAKESQTHTAEYANCPVFAEIVIAKDVLADTKMADQIKEAYIGCPADGYLIWIDDFSEVMVSAVLLAKYKDFLADLAATSKPIIAVHGGYFSTILSTKSFAFLAGVGHGIEYGEARPVIPVGGGVPRAKFYFPKFHERIDYSPDAENILLEMNWIENRDVYIKNVCSCPICSELMSQDVMIGFHEYAEEKISPKDGKAYPTAQAMNKSRRHYLYAKIEEYEFCRNSNGDKIVGRLQQYRDIAKSITCHSFDHLSKWISVLRPEKTNT